MVLLAAALVAASMSEVFHAEDPSQWGNPKRIVVPDYPKALLERRHTGHVDVEGSITPLQVMEVVGYQADSPASEPFVAAVKEVIDRWAFFPSIDDDCQPAPTRVQTRVFFEMDGDKPKISVTRRSPAASTKPRLKETYRHRLVYPRNMLQQGKQAYVYAGMHLDSAGKVTDVTATAFPGSASDLREFVREAKNSLGRWEFPPASAGSRPRVVCVEILFRLT